MTPTIAFWAGCGLYGLAVLFSLLGDGLSRGGAGALVSAMALIAGGAATLVYSWTSEPAFIWGAFVTGAGFSLIPGLAGVLAGLAILGDTPWTAGAGQRSALIALAALGAALVAQSADLITLVLSLEIAAAASYAIVSLDRTRRAREAAMKYFVQGAVATALILISVAVLAGSSTPSVTYADMRHAVGTAPTSALLLGATLLVAGLAFKAGAAPFHSWAPDSYEVAPPAGGAVLAGVVKAAAVSALCTTTGAVAFASPSAAAPLGLLGADVFPIVGAIGALSIGVGSVGALRQRSYLRMLGYAGVAQVGFALLALGARNVTSALIAIATYAVGATGAFLFARIASHADESWDGSVAGLAGCARRSPVGAAAISLLMMSMAGIPPFIGFWGKLQVFQSTIGAAVGLAGQGQMVLAAWYGALTVVGVVGATISVAYYGMVIRAVYSQGSELEGVAGGGSSLTVAVVSLLALATLLLGFLPLVLPASDAVRGFLM